MYLRMSMVPSRSLEPGCSGGREETSTVACCCMSTRLLVLRRGDGGTAPVLDVRGEASGVERVRCIMPKRDGPPRDAPRIVNISNNIG